MKKYILTTLLSIYCATSSFATTFVVTHFGDWEKDGGGFSGIFFRLYQLKDNTVNVVTASNDGKTSQIIKELPENKLYLQRITLNGREGLDSYMDTFDDIAYVVVSGGEYNVAYALFEKDALRITKDADKKHSTMTIHFKNTEIYVNATNAINFYDKNKNELLVQLHGTSVSPGHLNTPITGFRKNKAPSGNGAIPSGFKMVLSDTPPNNNAKDIFRN